MQPFKILFVDDEPNLLSGLRRMLRPFRKEWESHFCASGAEALDLLDQERFDMIISDLKMPEIDGVALLSSVSLQHPETIRFILSGQAEEQSLLRASSVAHQFLSKPCIAEDLRERINRALTVLHYGKGIEIVVQATNLPLSPVHAKKLVTLIEEEGSREEMQALLLADPALSAKLLQLSNGAFFGSKHSCNNSHDALMHIGLPMFAAFLKENGLLNTDEFHTLQFDWDWYYSISQTAATLAAHLAEQVGIDESIQRAIYTAGLFHRLGVLLLAYTKPEQFAASCNQTTETRVLDQSDGCFDIPQLQLSSKLLSLWGVPELITGTLSRINSPDSLLFDRNSLDPYLYLGASLAQQHCSATSQLFEIPFCSESVKRCSAVLGIETDTVNALCKEALDG